MPGDRARLRGREVSEVLKPGEGEREADEDVRMSWRSCGFVLAAYWPGRRWMAVGAPGADNTAPTI
jgi:hypothetical protein